MSSGSRSPCLAVTQVGVQSSCRELTVQLPSGQSLLHVPVHSLRAQTVFTFLKDYKNKSKEYTAESKCGPYKAKSTGCLSLYGKTGRPRPEGGASGSWRLLLYLLQLAERVQHISS